MKRKVEVVAVAAFTDALTGRDYRPGDEVAGWDRQRAALYQMRGLVECRAERPEPAPEETKPAGPTEVKGDNA